MRLFSSDILLRTLFPFVFYFIMEANSSVVNADEIMAIWKWNPKTRIRTIATAKKFNCISNCSTNLMMSPEFIRLSNNHDYIEIFRNSTMRALSGNVTSEYYPGLLLYQEIIDGMIKTKNSSYNARDGFFAQLKDVKIPNDYWGHTDVSFEYKSSAGSIRISRERSKIFYYHEDVNENFSFDLKTTHNIQAIEKAGVEEIAIDKTNIRRNQTRIFVYKNQSLIAVQTVSSYLNVDLKSGFLTWRLDMDHRPALILDNKIVSVNKYGGTFEVTCKSIFRPGSMCKHDDNDYKAADVEPGKKCGGYLVEKRIRTNDCNCISVYIANNLICIETHYAVQNATTLPSSNFKNNWIIYNIDFCNQFAIKTISASITIPDNRFCGLVLP